MEKEKTGFKSFVKLFLTFAFIGGTTFGGGYAMLPILQREIVEKHHWATDEELMDYFAIGQCTPGVIAVNTATFIGYKQFGLLGGIIATFGVVFPSIVIITIISAFLTNFAHLPVVIHAFNGIRAAVCVLIFDSVIKLGKKSVKDILCALVFLGILAMALFSGVSTIWLVVAAGVLGWLLKPFSPEARKEKEAKAEPPSGTDSRTDGESSGSGSEANSTVNGGEK
ncbi:MAG: chromate transporter [Lachnospiraceae bacterium]|nr:chromate transporter [Lachnospiraceae bacterium]